MAKPETFAGGLAFLRGGGAMAELIAAFDWASTSAGPIETWPVALKTATSMMLNSSWPMTLLIGEDALVLYNDMHAQEIDERHTAVLGAKAREVWPEHAGLTDQAVKVTQSGERLVYRDLELDVVRNGVSGKGWLNIDYSPVRDETGAWLGVMSITVETTERVVAERKAARQLDHLRTMFDQAPGFICLLGGPPDYRVEYANETYREVFGVGDIAGLPLVDAFPQAIANGDLDRLVNVYASGQRYLGRGAPVDVVRPDGRREQHFVDVVLEPLKDESGRVNGLFIEGFDVTAQVQAQRAADAAAHRLGAAVGLARLGTFELEVETREAKLDARAREIFGFGPDERVTDAAMVGRIDPDDIARIAAEDAAAVEAGSPRREAEYRIRLPDGSTRHVRAVGDVGAGPDGKPVWTIGMLEDVTERRRAELRQRMLINELNHRVKNTLATVQSIASQTLRSAPDLPQARAAFEARLMALSAAHDLLTAQSWRGAGLDEVAASALAPFEAAQKPQIVRGGPPVWLTAPRALALSLALHELATNATKYGALAAPDGRVGFEWRPEPGGLVCVWSEQGGPPASAPRRTGFGMRLLQRNLARELEGQVVLDFAPAGLRCEIRFPVEGPELVAEPPPSAAPPQPGRFWAPGPEAELRSFG